MSSNDELTTQEVIALFARTQGKALSPHTWRSYVYRGHAPAAVRKIGPTPVWRRGDIERWMRNRPGRPGRPSRGHDDT